MTDVNRSSRIAAEFTGTCFLLMAVVGSGIMAAKLSGGNVAVALLANSIATGAVLFVLISALGPLSGAHFNPVVSLVECLRGKLESTDLVLYLFAQLAGAIAGVLVAHAMFELPLVQTSATLRAGSGQWIAEAVASCGLILTILGFSRFASQNVATGVALYILSAYWFTASTSFANPAVTLARSLTDTFAGIAPGSVAMFLVAQVAGALLGLALSNVLFERPAR